MFYHMKMIEADLTILQVVFPPPRGVLRDIQYIIMQRVLVLVLYVQVGTSLKFSNMSFLFFFIYI